MKIWIETDGNQNLGEFTNLQKAQAYARKVKLTGYIFQGINLNDMESWRYFEGRCNDKPYGRANRSENFK